MVWAFIRYAPDVDAEGLAGISLNGELEDPIGLARKLKQRGKVHDLRRRSQRSMAEERQREAPEELAAELEALLQSRRGFDGQLVWSPLMQDEDVHTALAVIPSVSVYNFAALADLLTWEM